MNHTARTACCEGSPRQRKGDRHHRGRTQQPRLMDAMHELRRRDLVCWCAPLPCHGDVLLRLANKDT